MLYDPLFKSVYARPTKITSVVGYILKICQDLHPKKKKDKNPLCMLWASCRTGVDIQVS